MSIDGEGVYEPNFLGRAGRKGDLIVRLNALHKSLIELSQDPNDLPKGLQSTAAQLVSTKILSHSDKDVRLLSACCIVDVLRVFAPEAPFCDEEMVRVFEVIVSQIRSLSTYDIGSATGSKVVYILNSLSTVKSCVVPVIMAQSGVQGADELMTSLFDALISVFRPDHTEDVCNHMCSILQACIEELEDIDQDLLDIILAPLLPAAKIENPTAYQCVGNVLRRTAGCIQASVSAFLNHVLVGTAIPGKTKSSELADHIYVLIYEIHKISPGLLLRVLPNISVQLQAEEEDVRLKAVKLLGKLFASQHADYGSEFHRNFKDFLGRFVDVSAVIRLEMVDSCSAVMKSKPQHRATIEEHLMKRLRDEDVDVRLGSLSRLIELGTDTPDNLTVATFKEIGKRVSDRKLESLHGMCADLKGDDSSGLFDSDAPSASSTAMFSHVLKKDLLIKLGFIPGYVVNSWGYVEMRQLITQLLQENILPKTIASRTAVDSDSDASPPIAPVPHTTSRSNASKRASLESAAADLKAKEDLDSCRASALLLLYALLSVQERASLGTILGHKAKVRSDLTGLLAARSLAVSSNASSADQGHLKRTMKRLMLSLPPLDKKMFLLEKLHAVKDKTVFRLLHRSLSPEDSVTEASAHREDLRQRLDSKSPLGEYAACLYDAASFKVANSGMVGSLLHYAVTPSPGGRTELGTITATLLIALAKHAPQAFSSSAPILETWLEECSANCQSAHTTLKHLQDKKEKKKSGGHLMSQGLLAAQAEVRNCLFSFGQCVGAVRYIVQSVGVLGSSRSGGSSYSQAGDEGEGNMEQSRDLCRTMLMLARNQYNVELSVKLAEAATQLAIFSDVTQDQESNAPISRGNRKSTSSSTSTSTSSRGAGSTRSEVVDAIVSLSSTRNLSISNPRLAFDLSVLSALVTVPVSTSSTVDAKKLYVLSSIYQAALDAKDHVLTFLKGEVLTSGFEGSEDHGGASGGSGCSTADVVCAALKLWTALVSVTAESGTERALDGSASSGEREGDTPVREEDADMPEEVEELVATLFDCIGCEGVSVRGLEIDGSSSRSTVFESAALCAIETIKLRVVGRLLPVEKWHRLGWTFINPNENTRRKLLCALNSVIQTTAVHPRFLAYPCLLATDESLTPMAEQGLMFAVRRLRSTHDALCGVALEKDSDDLRALAEVNMPETLLPYVLHLLSYHPDFPTSSSIEDEADKKRLKGITKNLRMVIDTLLNSLQDDIGNLSFLLKQVNMISQHYRDAIDVENIGLNFVTILATKILCEKIKTVENVLAYPGDVRLPIELFQLREDSRNRDRNVLEGLGDVDQVIENVLKKGGRGQAGKGRAPVRAFLKNKSVSPKKRGSASPKNRRSASPADRRGHDDEDEDEGGARVAKKESKAKKAKPALPREAPQRVSSRLKVGGSSSVSYEETGESDAEADEWEAAAAEISLSQSKRNSRGGSQGRGRSPVKQTVGQTEIMEKEKEKEKAAKGSGFDQGESGDNSLAEEEMEERNVQRSKKGKVEDDDDDVYAFTSSSSRPVTLKRNSMYSSSASSSSSSSSSALVKVRGEDKDAEEEKIVSKRGGLVRKSGASPKYTTNSRDSDSAGSPALSESPVPDSPASPLKSKRNSLQINAKRSRAAVKEEEEEEEESTQESKEEEEESEESAPKKRSKVPPTRALKSSADIGGVVVRRGVKRSLPLPLSKDVSNILPPSKKNAVKEKVQKISSNKFFIRENRSDDSEPKKTAKIPQADPGSKGAQGRGRPPKGPAANTKKPTLIRA